MLVTLVLQSMLACYPLPREPEGPDKGPGYLGITFEAAPGGVLVSEVRESSPAQKAGLRMGDVILKYDGQLTQETDAFVQMIVRTRPGMVVPVEIRRDEKNRTLKVKIAARPDDFPYPLPQAREQPLDDPIQPLPVPEKK